MTSWFWNRWRRRFEPNELGMSPGPSGTPDLRMALTWLNKPGNYGPGSYGRRPSSHPERYCEIYVPGKLERNPALVLNLHGGGASPLQARYCSRMNEAAEEGGFIVAYPAGTHPEHWDRRLFWNNGEPIAHATWKPDDVRFIADLVSDLASFFRFDWRRVYACGHSNGASMVYRLAAELPDMIAAIAPVAAQRSVADFPGLRHPVSLCLFKGLLDPLAPYDGGERQGSDLFAATTCADTERAVASWAAHDRCQQVSRERIGKARREQYVGGVGGSEVTLWTLEDGGHTWPGGLETQFASQQLGVGPINQDIWASREMWKFFQRHAR